MFICGLNVENRKDGSGKLKSVQCMEADLIIRTASSSHRYAAGTETVVLSPAIFRVPWRMTSPEPM
ncbi:MAG: hypothetical protein ACON4U_10305 [Myxococcota bacterium]